MSSGIFVALLIICTIVSLVSVTITFVTLYIDHQTYSDHTLKGYNDMIKEISMKQCEREKPIIHQLMNAQDFFMEFHKIKFHMKQYGEDLNVIFQLLYSKQKDLRIFDSCGIHAHEKEDITNISPILLFDSFLNFMKKGFVISCVTDKAKYDKLIQVCSPRTYACHSNPTTILSQANNDWDLVYLDTIPNKWFHSVKAMNQNMFELTSLLKNQKQDVIVVFRKHGKSIDLVRYYLETTMQLKPICDKELLIYHIQFKST